MTLSDKIFSCRRRLGLSQEQLAEQLGVSRQAVSKWETGEATPELGKLAQLAATFGVTADWLLSEEETMPQTPPAPPQSSDALPRRLGGLLRRWGWLAGLYPMGCGLAMGLVALLMHSSLRRQLGALEAFGGEAVLFSPTHQMYRVSCVLLAVSAVLVLGGAALALYLRRRSKENKKTV